MKPERWLITGASGQLGGHVVHRLAREIQADDILALAGRGDADSLRATVERIDLRDADALRTTIRRFEPTHVLHLGAMTAVGDAYNHPDDAERINVAATSAISAICAEIGARLVFTSTDMVFDGQHAPYAETDRPRPVSLYGHTKLAAEKVVLMQPTALVVRPPLLYGIPATARESTFSRQLAALRAGEPLRLFTDEFRTPLWLADAARALIGLARTDHTGILHIAGPRRFSRMDMIAECARILGIANPQLVPTSRLSVASAEPRPADLSLRAETCWAAYPDLAPEALSAAHLEPLTE